MFYWEVKQCKRYIILCKRNTDIYAVNVCHENQSQSVSTMYYFFSGGEVQQYFKLYLILVYPNLILPSSEINPAHDILAIESINPF